MKKLVWMWNSISLIDRLLVVLIIVLVGANLWVVGREWLPKKPPSQPEWYKELMEDIQRKPLENDPPLGTEIEAFKRFSGRRLVVVIERCTECVIRSLKTWAEVTKATGLPKMVLVTQDPVEEAKRTLSQWQIEAEIVTDPEGVIAQKLNAFITPRVYAFENGRLVWKQEMLQIGPENALEVKK